MTEAANVEFRGVGKAFGSTRVLEDLNLVVNPGSFFSLLGPSGSGKSTILNLVSGLYNSDEGQVLIDGQDVSRIAPADRNIGVVFQNYALFPHMSVAGNIAYGLKRRKWKRARISSRVEEMLDLVGLAGLGNRMPTELSGGQQQRVALARALAFEPGLLLMDEPLAALDREIRVQMRSEIRRIHQEVSPTVIYVTHDRDEAFALSDGVGIMREGLLCHVGSPSELYESPQDAFVARFFCGFQVLNVSGAQREGDVYRISWEGKSGLVSAGGDLDEGMLMAVPPHAFLVGDGWAPARVIDIVPMGAVAHISLRLHSSGLTIAAEVPWFERKRFVLDSDLEVGIDFDRALLLPARESTDTSTIKTINRA